MVATDERENHFSTVGDDRESFQQGARIELKRRGDLFNRLRPRRGSFA